MSDTQTPTRPLIDQHDGIADNDRYGNTFRFEVFQADGHDLEDIASDTTGS